MQTAIDRKRMFVSGQLVEYWEHPEIAFGWSREDLQDYVDRADWILLFNAIVLTAPRPETDHGS